ncbi:hypothetical protein [Hydrogenophaga sp. MI9]|uniref:hypothetical protein n=1 Tax=Hydrogenophaga sp. MI9 TaxID=3453719 RepID=UPI003EEFB0EF
MSSVVLACVFFFCGRGCIGRFDGIVVGSLGILLCTRASQNFAQRAIEYARREYVVIKQQVEPPRLSWRPVGLSQAATMED